MRTDPQLLHGKSIDFLVVGAGIQGAAIARELVLRGARVAVVDRGDFGAETSMRSSRLIHGGLRYLRHGHLALVREALRERERLLRHVPHLVRPIPMLLPIFRDGGGAPAWQLGVGVRLYSWLAGRRSTLPGPRTLRPAAAAEAFPGLRTDGLKKAFRFWDAATEDLPLTHVVLDDAADAGATLANYTELVGVQGGQVRLRDLVSGGEVECRAGMIVNAAGPWVDEVRRVLGIDGENLVRTSRGSHVILDPRQGETCLAAFLPDGRIQFVIPHVDGTVCGTTEVAEELDGLPATVPEEDLRYMLDALGWLLDPAPTRDDLRLGYAGWRALPAVRGPSGALNREAFLVEERAAVAVASVVGGKLTTHRAFAERAAVQLMGPGPSPTRDRPPRKGSGPAEPGDPLWQRHGADSQRIRELAREFGDARIGPGRDFAVAEAIYALRHTGVVNFRDLAVRRLFHTCGPSLEDDWLRPLFDLYLEHRQGAADPGKDGDYSAAKARLVADLERMSGAVPIRPACE